MNHRRAESSVADTGGETAILLAPQDVQLFALGVFARK